MAGTIKTKAQLYSDSAALPTPITRTALVAHMDNIVASYEDIFIEYTIAQRDALTPAEGQIIYNIDLHRLEVFESVEWVAVSPVEQTLIDCSANPNYPEGAVQDIYYVQNAGKIGGASGKIVYVGDLIFCIALNNGGDEATAGGSWKVIRANSTTDTPTLYAEIDLSSAEILALNGTPKQIVAAPGAGKIIVPSMFVINYSFLTAAYATNTNMQYGNPSGTYVTIFDLTAAASKITTAAATGTTVIDNEKLEIKVATGNPTAGSGTATVGVYYKIHTL